LAAAAAEHEHTRQHQQDQHQPFLQATVSSGSRNSKMFKLLHPRWDPVALHDYFNLVVIAILNVENLTYLATGKGFELFFTSAMVYFLLDTIFVGVYPQSVKSPVVILSHHICTALYMLIPYSYPHYQWCMAYCMLVEINTWLLIARRQLGGKLTEVRQLFATAAVAAGQCVAHAPLQELVSAFQSCAISRL
jgi:hypothetical protein